MIEGTMSHPAVESSVFQHLFCLLWEEWELEGGLF